MLSASLITALFAAGVLSKPILHQHNNRDEVIVTDIAVVWDTVIVTKNVWVNAPAPTSKAAAAPAPVAPTTFAAPNYAPASTSAAPAPASYAAPAPAPSNPAPSYNGGGGLSEYQQAVLNHHNVHRANHSAADLVWSDNLAAIAAQEAAVCVFAHDVTTGGGGYGQNIAAGVPSTNVSEIITGMFYNGEVNNYAGYYGEVNPNFDNFDSWGHFSQVVWKGTTSVGCATASCEGTALNMPFTVCNYGPPGNMGGEYGTNVGEPLNHPTVQWNYGGEY